jgi:hypothetical protein
MADTGRTLIADALVELGVLGAGQTADAEDEALLQTRLNKMIQAFNTEGLNIFQVEEDIYLLNANKVSPTIGPSGDFIATRPFKIEAANTIDITGNIISSGATTGAGDKVLTDATKNFTTLGVVAGRDLVYIVSGTGVTAGIYRIATVGTTTLTLTTNPGSSGSAISYRVIMIPAREPIDFEHDLRWWAELGRRGASGVPSDGYYETSFPNGTLNLYPVSSSALGLELFVQTLLTTITDLTLSLSFPDGYYELYLYNLAYRGAKPFKKNPADFAQLAAEARARVKSVNERIPNLKSDVPRMGGRW